MDASFPHGLGRPIPAGAAGALLNSAIEHEAAMVPATEEERQTILRGLRSATIITQEDAAEAKMTMSLLVHHLEDVPLDILEAGCRAYCNAPGRRFFPKSAGELRTFIGPLMHSRQSRAWRLRWLADQAAREERERAERGAPLEAITPAEIRAMTEQLRRIALGQGWLTQQQIDEALKDEEHGVGA